MINTIDTIDSRVYLKENQVIELSVNRDGSNPERYIIRSVIGEGGCAVCYEAIRERDGQTGKLKEYYPVTAVNDTQTFYYSLKRLPNGQLIPNAGTIRCFDKMCDNYLSSYRKIRNMIAKLPETELFKNFIQVGDTLYGSLDANEYDNVLPTVYIWSPGIAGRGFDSYLNEIRQQPSVLSDQKINRILLAAITLSDSIISLHSAGLLHLDIKPSNFLIPFNSDFDINPGSISMFDVDTLCFIEDDAPHTIGTFGYRAPELLKNACDNRSDIYSIGAILFNAFVISPDIPDGLYRDEFFQKIETLLCQSELFLNSKSSQDVILMAKLCEILKKCLNPKANLRYSACSDLKKALLAAELRSKTYAVDNSLLGNNQRLAIIGEQTKSDATLVIRKLLYDHPLFENLRPDAHRINILTVGAGNIGQKFIDICLQVGQMQGKKLVITALSDNPSEALSSYLMFRPYINRFVNVNRSMIRSPHYKDSYGTLDFVPLPDASQTAFRLGEEWKHDNKTIISRLVLNAKSNGQPFDYIFVALGDDLLNEQIARLFSDVISDCCYSDTCPVCYVSEKIKKANQKDKRSMLFPVCINESISPDTIDPSLEQMAFNTHLSWNSTLNLDVTNSLNQFRSDSYYYSSSIAFALSVPYKLYSIGIAFRNKLRNANMLKGYTMVDTPLEAAQAFFDQVVKRMEYDAVARLKFNTLSALEHSRWVIDLCSQGYSIPTDENGNLCLENCVRDLSVKNKNNKTHPCLVFSTPSSPLNDAKYNHNHKAKWDDRFIEPSLDDLDRISIKLHQCFKKHADLLRAENPLENEDMKIIADLLDKSDSKAQYMFRQFRFCLKNILNGVESYTRQYDYYEKSFVDSLESLPKEKTDQIISRLDIIRKRFFSIKEANLYRNYKENDEILIKNIPFILSFHFRESIAMAFEDGRTQNGRNNALFANVASATVLSPKKIHYLYCFDRDSDPQHISKKLSSVINYLGKRKVHCSVTFTVLCLKTTDYEQITVLLTLLDSLKNENSKSTGNTSFADYSIIKCNDIVESREKLISYLSEIRPDLYDGSVCLFPSSVSESGDFARSVIENSIPYFEFDRKTKSFTKHIGCDDLIYRSDGSYIHINDMFALMNASDIRCYQPDFAENYEKLWSIYSGNYLSVHNFDQGVKNWNTLCFALKEYHSLQKPLAVLKIPKDQADSTKSVFTFVLPDFTFNTVKKLLALLKEYNAVGVESSLTTYTADSCKLVLHSYPSLERDLSEIFSDESKLLDYYDICVEKSADGRTIVVDWNDPKVSDICIDPNCVELLHALERDHFISALRKTSDGSRYSFKYSVTMIKRLLTNAEEILTIYAYYQILKTGFFDDVACNYEFCWENSMVHNTLDLVLTKGFRSIIIESKTVQKLDLYFYHKLHSVAEHFGIGVTTVLLGNTYGSIDKNVINDNHIQSMRGDQLGIKTFTNEKELTDIGTILVDMFKN